MFLVLCLCLVHTATSSTAAQSFLRNPTDGPPSEGGALSYAASELEYRPGKSGDMMFGTTTARLWNSRMFVAVDPKAPDGRNVVGYVEWSVAYPAPLCVQSALSEKEKRGRVVYIMQVQVRKDWRNKKVGSMMLPRALEHIHWNWPSAVGVHLTVKRANKYAIKLYEKFNFTHVGGENRSALL
ncbi:hypothetical protein FOZ62_006285 [Perkinsus olseni]|uniref:N-acetyltransferase domain-containing protein n=1 Tax=Perkinsus olseni TaxID=32597 RepID=A0A7J6P6A7_PEROL|nr:hypothetical protein FOZ62_006285 [Perkinsus olseni]